MANYFIAVGGTGQMVAMAYWRIRKLMPWIDHGDTKLYHMDKDVIGNYQRTVDQQSDPINPLHKDVANKKFGQYLADPNHHELCKEILDSLFTSEEQDTPIVQGMFARPPVGATVLMDMLNDPDQEMEDLLNRLMDGNDHTIVICGSGIGGTGAGGVPSLAQHIDKKLGNEGSRGNVKIYLFYFLRHFHLSQPKDADRDRKITNTKIMSNSESGICYLKDNIAEGTDACLILGLDQTSERKYQEVTNQKEHSQPLYLIASLYVQNVFACSQNIFGENGLIYAHAVGDAVQIEKNGVALLLDQNDRNKTMELHDLIRLNKAAIKIADRIKNLIHPLPHGIFYRGIPGKLNSALKKLANNNNYNEAFAAEKLSEKLTEKEADIKKILDWYAETNSETISPGFLLSKDEELSEPKFQKMFDPTKFQKMLNPPIGFIKQVDRQLNLHTIQDQNFDYNQISNHIYSMICLTMKETHFSDK